MSHNVSVFQSPTLCYRNVRLASWILLCFLSFHLPVAFANTGAIGWNGVYLILLHGLSLLALTLWPNSDVTRLRKGLVSVFVSYIVSASVAWRLNIGIHDNFLIGIVASAYLYGVNEQHARTRLCGILMGSYIAITLFWLWPVSGWRAKLEVANSISLVVCLFILSALLHRSSQYEWSNIAHSLARSKRRLSQYWPYADNTQEAHWRPGTCAHIAKASVLFIDIVEFASLCKQRSDTSIVNLLHNLYCQFDQVLLTYGCQKLKTNGDEYMACTPLALYADNKKADNQQAIINLCMAARAMIESLQVIERLHEIKLNIRIGIATGPITAGVMGETRPMLDIWGTTVNLASRLEHVADTNQINICKNTAHIVKAHFLLDEERTTNIRGIGTVTHYQLGICMAQSRQA